MDDGEQSGHSSYCDDVDSPDISSGLLKSVLYGRWISWGGIPPTLSRQSVLRKVPKGVLESAPPQVRLGASSVPGRPVGVFASAVIKEGTEVGPFPGAVQTDSNLTDRGNQAWEVFGPRSRVKCVVDGGAASAPSWMTYIQCARNETEQNLETFQTGDNIYYRVTKTISPGEELLVWYGADIVQFMGVPDIYSQDLHTWKNEQDVPSVDCTPPSGGKLKCVVCRRGFNSRSNLRSHMRIHTLERPFSCKYCGRTFSQSSTLRNHLRLHTGERPYKCLICQRAYSQLAGLRAHQRSARHRPLPSGTTGT